MIDFDIKICGRLEATSLIERGWPTRIITLTCEDIPLAGDHHLQVAFNDISRPIDGRVLPTMEHLASILAFTQALTADDRLLVHCMLGISRSTAAAIAILIQHGMSYDAAFRHIETLRPILLPNQLLIQHCDEHFGLNGALVARVSDHRTSAIRIPLALLQSVDSAL